MFPQLPYFSDFAEPFESILPCDKSIAFLLHSGHCVYLWASNDEQSRHYSCPWEAIERNSNLSHKEIKYLHIFKLLNTP